MQTEVSKRSEYNQQPGVWLPLVLYYITIGNRTPGSRFYSNRLDTLAESLCTHQLVLSARPGSELAARSN